MSDLCDDFDKRFTSSFFSASWVEVQPVQKIVAVDEAHRKNLEDLQLELSTLKSDVENISFKALRLSNLAKFYQ